MKIYLAGKITKNGWRHDIVPGLRDAGRYELGFYGYDKIEKITWPILYGRMVNGHDYTGPYFVSCDHGCFHGKGRDSGPAHGWGDEGYCGYGAGDDTKKFVTSLCRRAIEGSDLLFAWIDSPDCYGTLVEIGIAFALHKKIRIAFRRDMPWTEDFWFAASLSEHFGDFDNALEAYMEMVPPPRIDYYEYIKSDEWRAKADAAKERAGFRCQVCNAGLGIVLHAHHRTYERLGNELPEDITVLCKRCHYTFHKRKP